MKKIMFTLTLPALILLWTNALMATKKPSPLPTLVEVEAKKHTADIANKFTSDEVCGMQHFLPVCPLDQKEEERQIRKSPFRQLAKLFKQGSLPSQKDLENLNKPATLQALKEGHSYNHKFFGQDTHNLSHLFVANLSQQLSHSENTLPARETSNSVLVLAPFHDHLEELFSLDSLRKKITDLNLNINELNLNKDPSIEYLVWWNLEKNWVQVETTTTRIYLRKYNDMLIEKRVPKDLFIKIRYAYYFFED